MKLALAADGRPRGAAMRDPAAEQNHQRDPGDQVRDQEQRDQPLRQQLLCARVTKDDGIARDRDRRDRSQHADLYQRRDVKTALT